VHRAAACHILIWILHSIRRGPQTKILQAAATAGPGWAPCVRDQCCGLPSSPLQFYMTVLHWLSSWSSACRPFVTVDGWPRAVSVDGCRPSSCKIKKRLVRRRRETNGPRGPLEGPLHPLEGPRDHCQNLLFSQPFRFQVLVVHITWYGAAKCHARHHLGYSRDC